VAEDRDFEARLAKTSGRAFGCRSGPALVQRRHDFNLSDFNDFGIMF
jgi:hypothetical protein